MDDEFKNEGTRLYGLQSRSVREFDDLRLKLDNLTEKVTALDVDVQNLVASNHSLEASHRVLDLRQTKTDAMVLGLQLEIRRSHTDTKMSIELLASEQRSSLEKINQTLVGLCEALKSELIL